MGEERRGDHRLLRCARRRYLLRQVPVNPRREGQEGQGGGEGAGGGAREAVNRHTESNCMADITLTDPAVSEDSSTGIPRFTCSRLFVMRDQRAILHFIGCDGGCRVLVCVSGVWACLG